jgi:hypothetical protein
VTGTVRQPEIEQRQIESGVTGSRRKSAGEITHAGHVGSPLEREKREAQCIRHHGVIVDHENLHPTMPLFLDV